jgi:hypothetical protein
VQGIETELPRGDYNVVIVASGSNVRPQEEGFAVSITPERLLFPKRD